MSPDLSDLSEPDNEDQLARKAQLTESTIQSNLSGGGSGHALCIAGYPGAGKTVAADAIYERLDKELSDSTQLVQANVEQTVKSATDSKKAFEFAVETPSLLAKEVSRSHGFSSVDVAVIDGACSMGEIEHYANHFSNIKVLFIEVNGLARHDRLTTEDGGKSRDARMERDGLADERGLDEIVTAQFYDKKLTNNDLELNEFQKAAGYVGYEFYRDIRS
jgi:shikimate kinase